MQVTRTEAERAAVKSLYLTDNGYLTRQLVVTGVVEKRFGENVALYEILFETGESVIISGSRASQPIVAINIHSNGYSWLNNQEGRESGFLLLLENRYQSIGRSFSGNFAINEEWNRINFIDRINSRNVYGPYLNTLWEQDWAEECECSDMYNKYLPYSDGDCICQHDNTTINNYPSGCTVTAIAQLMNYWVYPVIFNNTEQIDWCNMPKQIICGETSDEQNEAVARLYKLLGETFGTSYGSLISFNNVDNANIDSSRNHSNCYGYLNPAYTEDELHEIFGYSGDMSVKARVWYGSNDWTGLIKNEIIEGRPVLYWAFEANPTHGAHTFVCDGYNDATGQFHFNFGNRNAAWCSIDDIVEGSHHWTFDECAMIKIKPGDAQDFCDYTLYLEDFYDMFYSTHNLSSCNPYDITPNAATKLYSSRLSSPAVYRTIPNGANAQYQGRNEIVLCDGFTARRGCDFTVRIVPCERCEERDIDGIDAPAEDANDYGYQNNAGNGEPMAYAKDRPITEEGLYPNPTDGKVTVATDGKVKSIVIYTLDGRPVGGWKFLSLTDNQATLDVSSLADGIYILTVRTKSGTTAKKLTVVR